MPFPPTSLSPCKPRQRSGRPPIIWWSRRRDAATLPRARPLPVGRGEPRCPVPFCFNCLPTKQRPFGDKQSDLKHAPPRAEPMIETGGSGNKNGAVTVLQSLVMAPRYCDQPSKRPSRSQEAGQLSARGWNGRELSIRALDETNWRGGARLSVRVFASTLGAHLGDRLWSTEHSGIKRRIEWSSDLLLLKLV
jgi:hypothetical protein